MPNARDAQRKRLTNGLTVDQNLVLQELSHTANWKDACDRAGVSRERFRVWIRRDEAFRRQFEQLHTGAVEAVRKQLESSAQKAAEAFDDALDATKDVKLEITCPQCKADIKIEAEVPDHNTRIKAGEVILKVNKILKDVKEMEGRVTVAALPLHLQLALAAYNANQPIPPGAERELKELGFIQGAPALGEPAFEGEFRKVEEDEDSDYEIDAEDGGRAA